MEHQIKFSGDDIVYPSNPPNITIKGNDFFETFIDGGGNIFIKPKWIPVKDKLPEDKLDVLIYNGENITVSCYLKIYNQIYNQITWSHDNEDYDYDKVTHWMNLPSKPEY